MANIWRWNGQRIVPLPKGRIRYRVASAYGPMTRDGVRLSDHFAADHHNGLWWMTHLPSGRLMPNGTRSSLKGSRELAQRLERAADCSRHPKKIDRASIERVLGLRKASAA